MYAFSKMDESLTDVPKSLRFLHIQHKSGDHFKYCDNKTPSENVCKLLPNVSLLSSVANNNDSIDSHSNTFGLQTPQYSNERSVQTFDIRYTNPKEIFGKFGDDRKLSKSLPELRGLDYLSNFSVQSNKETESLTDISLLSQNITPNWKSKADFLFTAITLSLGLNNIWR